MIGNDCFMGGVRVNRGERFDGSEGSVWVLLRGKITGSSHCGGYDFNKTVIICICIMESVSYRCWRYSFVVLQLW